MVSFQSGNVQQVSNQTGVAVSTIYSWLSDWNKTQRLEKKKR
jgi:transposase